MFKLYGGIGCNNSLVKQYYLHDNHQRLYLTTVYKASNLIKVLHGESVALGHR